MEDDNVFRKVEDDYGNVDPKKEKQQEEKEEAKPEGGSSMKYFLITVAIIILMLVAIFGIRYVIKPNEKLETVSYNNFTFVKNGPLWYTNWKDSQGQVFTIPLHFNPKQAENVTISGKLSDKFNYNNIYVTHDPAEYGLEYVNVASAELAMNLATALDMNLTAACARNETEPCSSRPIKSCSSNSSVIYIKEGGETAINLNNTCITLQGEQGELLRAVDKLLYVWYGIIKP